MCVWSIQSESFEVARIFSEAEARRVGNLLQVSAEALQTVITHRVTVSTIHLPLQPSSTYYHLFYILSTSTLARNSIWMLEKDMIAFYCLCVQETTYDRIYCPLSVECAIESRWGMALLY